MTETDEPDHFEGRWGLDVRGRAQRQLARLPEKIATAVAEFITGQLLVNPLRVGHPLRDEYEGQYSTRRGERGSPPGSQR
ncbi:MAG: type II toxin-antitoxin system RelE family toxin [Pseudonocardiaceae bacterium]